MCNPGRMTTFWSHLAMHGPNMIARWPDGRSVCGILHWVFYTAVSQGFRNAYVYVYELKFSGFIPYYQDTTPQKYRFRGVRISVRKFFHNSVEGCGLCATPLPSQCKMPSPSRKIQKRVEAFYKTGNAQAAQKQLKRDAQSNKQETSCMQARLALPCKHALHCHATPPHTHGSHVCRVCARSGCSSGSTAAQQPQLSDEDGHDAHAAAVRRVRTRIAQ